MACRCPSGWGPSWIGRLLSFQFSQIIHTKDVVFTDLMERQLPLFGPSSHSYFPNLQVFRTFPKLHHQCLVPQNLQGFLKGFVKLPGHTAFPAWWRRRRPSLPPAQKVPEYSSVFFLLQWWTGFSAYILLHLYLCECLFSYISCQGLFSLHPALPTFWFEKVIQLQADGFVTPTIVQR